MHADWGKSLLFGGGGGCGCGSGGGGGGDACDGCLFGWQ